MTIDGSVARRVRRWWGRALAGLVFGVTACGGGSADHVAPLGDDIVVGAAISLTGSLSQEGLLTQRGFQMWRTWANDRGGIEVGGVRHLVRLVIQDDQSRSDQSQALTTDMVKAGGVEFLLGPYGSDSTAAVAVVAEQYEIPLVASGGAAQSIFDHGYRFTFGVISLTDQYMAGVLELAARLTPRPRTVALLWANDRFSQEVAESVVALAPVRGLQIVYSKSYAAGSTDVSDMVAGAVATKPDILINSGHLAEAVAIHRAARELSLNAKLFAYSVGPSTTEFIADLGPDADYVFADAQWTPQVHYRPQMYLTVPEYIAAYRKMFRTLDEPPYQTADATGAGLALQRAIEDAASTRPQAVRDALSRLDVTTFLGRIKFDSRGANVYKPMVVEQIQRSRHHTVYPPDVADVPPVYPTPPWSQRP